MTKVAYSSPFSDSENGKKERTMNYYELEKRYGTSGAKRQDEAS